MDAKFGKKNEKKDPFWNEDHCFPNWKHLRQ